MDLSDLSRLRAEANRPLTYADADSLGVLDIDAPTMPLRTYGQIRWSQIIGGIGRYGFGPGEEPVIMRGSMWCISRKYQPMYWYRVSVWERLIRRKKMNFFLKRDLYEFLADLRPIRNEFLQRGNINSAIQTLTGKVGHLWDDQFGAVIDGKFVEINQKQYDSIIRLRKEIERFDKLEKRRKRVS